MIALARLGWPIAACGALMTALLMPAMLLERALPQVILIIDITQSMNVTDTVIAEHATSRLEFVKSAARKAIAELPCGSEVGLGIFTQFRSFLLSMPIETCANQKDIQANIEQINGQMAWASGSEIAKGLYLTLRMLKQLNPAPRLMFITDGHEAPPIDPLHRINVADEAGPVRGMIVGVGGDRLVPIPKVDPEGNPAGFWGPKDVMQEDLYAHGRQGTVANEAMEETAPTTPIPPALRREPGMEHLSSLREPYLQLLATEAHLQYRRLNESADFKALLQSGEVTVPQKIQVDVRWIAGLAALAATLFQYFIKKPSAARRKAIAT